MSLRRPTARCQLPLSTWQRTISESFMVLAEFYCFNHHTQVLSTSSTCHDERNNTSMHHHHTSVAPNINIRGSRHVSSPWCVFSYFLFILFSSTDRFLGYLLPIPIQRHTAHHERLGKYDSTVVFPRSPSPLWPWATWTVTPITFEWSILAFVYL